MKHLLTAIACCLAVAGSAQTWNPDADFNNNIGVEDLMALLSVFGTEWTAEYPASPEYDLAAYYEGTLQLGHCLAACAANNARVPTAWQLAKFIDDANEAAGVSSFEGICAQCNGCYEETEAKFHIRQSDAYSVWLSVSSIDCTSIDPTPNLSMYVQQNDYAYSHSRHCVCTGLVPAVE